MSEGSPGRPWPMLDATLFGGALAIYALGLPLGLARIEAAPQVAAAVALDTSAEPATYGLLVMRLAQLLPLGDLPLRANLASALVVALAVMLFGRLSVQVLVALRPVANARQEPRELLHEPIAASVAALTLLFSLSTFEIATTSGTAAMTLLLLALGVLAGLALLEHSTSSATGLSYAAIAGLSSGVDAVAGPLLWPLLAGLAIWALRKGARWPLLAPVCFVAAWGGSALATVACCRTPATLPGLFSPLGHLGANLGAGLWVTATELADQLGVIGALLAAIGIAVAGMRAALLTAWLLLTLLSAMMFGHAVGGPAEARAALPVAVALSAVFASAGLLHVASRLGRARMAATVTLAVMLVLSPALDGGRARWLRRSALPMHLLDHALARAELRSVVDPGTPAIAGLFHLAHAMGLRPDLLIKK